MSGAIPVLKFLFKGNFPVLTDSLNQGKFEVEDFSTADDLATYLSTIPAGLIITSLRDKEDLVQIATFMKIAKKVAKNSAFKLSVINFSGDKNFEKAIAKLGILDLIEPGINSKGLKFKMDFWMKAISAQAKKNNLTGAFNTKTAEEKPQEKKTVDLSAPAWTAPLDLEDDIWILKTENDCKKILGKWLVRFVGPGPFVGQWVEVKTGVWRFDIKDSEKELYVPNEGAWFFAGDQKPDFVWKENNWMFTGETFELFFKGPEKVFSRMKSKEKVLSIAKNSVFAETKEAVIKESFDKELVFKKEVSKIDDLEGKNKTDNLGGNLSGSVESTDDLSSGQLSQKAEKTTEKTHWKGKNAYEEMGTGDLSGPSGGNPHSGSDLSIDPKNPKHQTHYKNHNPAEKFDPADLNHGPASGALPEGKLLDQARGEGHVETHYKNKNPHPGQNEASDPHSSPSAGGIHQGKELGLDRDDLSHDKFYRGKNPASDSKEEKPKSDPEADRQTAREIAERMARAQQASDAKNSTQGEAEAKQQGTRPTVEALKKGQAEPEKNSSETEEQRREAQEIAKKLNSAGSSQAKPETPYDLDEELRKAREMARAKEEKTKTEPAAADLTGESATDKLSSHLGGPKEKSESQGKKDEAEGPVEKASVDTYEDLFFTEDPKPHTPPSQASKEKASSYKGPDREKEGKILPFLAEDKDDEAITSDAQILSLLIQGGREIQCKIDDYFENTIIFLTKDPSVNASAKAQLDLQFNYMKKSKALKLEGDVQSIDDDGEGGFYITVSIDQKQASDFVGFMTLYRERQVNIDLFLKKVKGL
jgi:hypothetical protein